MLKPRTAKEKQKNRLTTRYIINSLSLYIYIYILHFVVLSLLRRKRYWKRKLQKRRLTFCRLSITGHRFVCSTSLVKSSGGGGPGLYDELAEFYALESFGSYFLGDAFARLAML